MGCCLSSNGAHGEFLQQSCMESKEKFLQAKQSCKDKLGIDKIDKVETASVSNALNVCDELCGKPSSLLSASEKASLLKACATLHAAGDHYDATVSLTLRLMR